HRLGGLVLAVGASLAIGRGLTSLHGSDCGTPITTVGREPPWKRGGWNKTQAQADMFTGGPVSRRNFLICSGALAAGLRAGVVGANANAPRGISARVSRSRRPNVLLVVLDTVRAANMSLYGYGRLTTPRLARWATSGVVFERAISTAPWTTPSHASIFTG